MFETPILFLVFNRPAETKLVFEAIRQAEPKYLYVAADGAREGKAGEQQLCDEVSSIVNNVDWPCEVNTLCRDTNLGCRKAVSEAITWFFSFVEQGIILEDDCLPDQSFFPFCEALLNKYKDDQSIISIGGTNLGYTFPANESYSFSRFMNMWGWATWRRSAELVDYNMAQWKGQSFKKLFLQKKLSDNFFSLDYNWVKYWKSYFDLTAAGAIDTWDYQWIFTQLFHQKLSVFPAKNLVKNIGFTETATHTFHPGHAISNIPLGSMAFPLAAPVKKQIDQQYEDSFIKKIWFNYRKDSLYKILRSDLLNKPAVSKMIRFFKQAP